MCDASSVLRASNGASEALTHPDMLAIGMARMASTPEYVPVMEQPQIASHHVLCSNTRDGLSWMPPMANTTAIKNPDTPLAFLPPALGDQYEASRYVHVATCGVSQFYTTPIAIRHYSSAGNKMFSWDILINMRNDYRLLTQSRIGIPTIVYFLSR